ncbi:hyalin [Apostichopus japonicus]|uniref:Hyalin n=1 Tax=Stichopus japonicus TaxID=307972 RepID=A0A2G8LN54_STIJA|nr:hyalin [Apostichopus japonicus]
MREEELGTTEILVFWMEPTAVDVPPGPVQLESRSFAPDSLFPVPATLGQVERRTVSYVFADANLNRATCVFTVSVTAVDTTPPVISGCPGVQQGTVEVGTNEQASIVWTEPTATDLSGTSTLNQRTHPPGSQFPSGVTSVTYSFTDSSNNEATCQFTVVVTTVDTRPPVPIGCPTIVPATVELGVTGTVVSWDVPTATDLSELPVTIVPSRQPNSFFVVGSTEVTYTFTDQAGNMAECLLELLYQKPQVLRSTKIKNKIPHKLPSLTLSLSKLPLEKVDTIPPQVFGCPNTVPEVIELGISRVSVSWPPPFATDDSEPPPVTVGSTAAPGDLFPPGPTTVLYTFTDSSGNANTCEFTVLVTTGHIQWRSQGYWSRGARMVCRGAFDTI